MQVTQQRDQALKELSDLVGVPIHSPLVGTEPVPEHLNIDAGKLKAYMDRVLGVKSTCKHMLQRFHKWLTCAALHNGCEIGRASCRERV